MSNFRLLQLLLLLMLFMLLLVLLLLAPLLALLLLLDRFRQLLLLFMLLLLLWCFLWGHILLDRRVCRLQSFPVALQDQQWGRRPSTMAKIVRPRQVNKSRKLFRVIVIYRGKILGGNARLAYGWRNILDFPKSCEKGPIRSSVRYMSITCSTTLVFRVPMY